MKNTFSFAILTFDNENTIRALLHQLAQFGQEIVIIDGKSKDKTTSIAKFFPSVKIHYVANDLDFATKRNLAMKIAKNDWIFFIDSDELLSKALIVCLQTWISSDLASTVAYRVSRVDEFLGKKIYYGEVLAARKRGIVRFVKRTSGKFVGKVHEQFFANGKIQFLQGELIHHPHTTVSSFLQAVNLYSTKRAMELYEQKKDFKFGEMFFFPLGKFFYTFIFLGGFLDGERGFIYSFVMALHSFLVRGKLFLLNQGKRAEHDFF